MKIVAAVVSLALGMGWAPLTRAKEEIQPVFDGLERGWDAAETYRLNALGIVRESVTGPSPSFFPGRESWWRPVRGKFRWPTKYNDFYLKMGRDDLGERDRHRRVLSSSLFWGGWIVTAGGIVVMLSGLASHHNTRAWGGVGMFAGGFVMTTVGSRIQPPLVSDEDAEAMVNEYNRRLQIHLGLVPSGESSGHARYPLGFALSHRW